MPNPQILSTPPRNLLLARLPADEVQRLMPRLESIPFEFKQILYEAESPIDYAYFPTRGVLSAVTVMEDGRSIEVACIGAEGMVGLPVCLEAGLAPNRVIVQVEGEGLRMRADDLKAETSGPTPLRRLLIRYQAAFLMQALQSVACNGLHTVLQRCCRWLLLTHDSVGTDALPLTHELLGMALGVRRNSVTEILKQLQAQGLVRTGRGQITVLNRDGLDAASCECYRTVQEWIRRLLG